MKLLAKTFNIPIDSKQLKNKQFQSAISQLVQREQQILNYKFIKDQQSQNRIKKLEKDYQQWVHNKQSSFRHKLQKSEKNRLQIRDKIVQKCKDNNKVINQKVKIAFSKRRQSLKQAWKAANKFNDKIHLKKIKHSMIQPSKQQQKKDQGDCKSVQFEQQQGQSQNIFISQMNPSKLVSTRNTKPLQKSFDTKMFHSTFNINKSTQNMLQKYHAHNKPNTQNPQQKQYDKRHRLTEQLNQNDLYERKLRMTLSRHRQHVCELENRKIQELGQRLDKIQQSRIKRQELHKSHLRRSDIDLSYDNEQQKSQPKQGKKLIKQRLKSENSKLDRQRRGSDWQQTNRMRRQQIQLAQLQNGSSYLSSNKIRYMKQVLAKSISYNAIEQKLYYQRLKH